MALATPPKPRVTSDEFLAGPEIRGELLIDGEVFMFEPTHLHQQLCSSIFVALHDWTRTPEGRGRVGWGGNWVLDDHTVVAPDVWWMPDPAGPGTALKHDGPPALAVEVLSPGTRHLDLGKKGERYRVAGLPELWLVDPGNRMVVARRFMSDRDEDDDEFADGATITSPQLPGFGLAIEELFGGPGTS